MTGNPLPAAAGSVRRGARQKWTPPARVPHRTWRDWGMRALSLVTGGRAEICLSLLHFCFMAIYLSWELPPIPSPGCDPQAPSTRRWSKAPCWLPRLLVAPLFLLHLLAQGLNIPMGASIPSDGLTLLVVQQQQPDFMASIPTQAGEAACPANNKAAGYMREVWACPSSIACANLVFKACAKWPHLHEKRLLGEILGQILFSFMSLQTCSISSDTRNATYVLYKHDESGSWLRVSALLDI